MHRNELLACGISQAAQAVQNPPGDDPHQWSVADVAYWLVSNGMARHVPAFAAAQIGGSELCVLTEAELMAAPLSLKPLQARTLLRYRDEVGLFKCQFLQSHSFFM